MNKEKLREVVDDNDNVIGKFPKNQVMAERMMYRLIAVFVYNSEGKLFLQLRNKSKKRFPGYYESSVGGHVEIGETYLEAAQREMEEELGISEKLELVRKNKVAYDDHQRFVSLFKCSTDQKMRLSDEEIESGKFYAIKKIKKMIRNNEHFTPVFLQMFKEIYKK